MVFAATAWAIVRITGIVIAGGGDYTLSVVPSATPGVVRLQPGVVTHFTLTSDGVANGHRVRLEAAGVNAGDGLVYGQAAASADFTGTYPALALTAPILRGSVVLPVEALAQGTCDEEGAALNGASIGMAASVTTPNLADAISAARVSGPDTVTVRVCALANIALNGQVVQVAVVP